MLAQNDHPLVLVVTRDGRFGSKVGQIGPQIGQIWDEPHVLKSDLKKSRISFVQFGANLTQFGYKA